MINTSVITLKRLPRQEIFKRVPAYLQQYIFFNRFSIYSGDNRERTIFLLVAAALSTRFESFIMIRIASTISLVRSNETRNPFSLSVNHSFAHEVSD